ncbi:MAG: hypothetical protein WDZ85_02140 [Candidatus Paceibacterota bacterium]
MNNISETLLKLPKPLAVYSTAEAEFEIYRAKDLNNKKWLDKSLYKILALARGSYKKYGARELFDKYDDKAVIYLARARYGKETEEWLSVRMVPGDGLFTGIGEIELYKYKNQPVPKLLCDKMNWSNKNLWSKVYSDSRMCGVHPCFINKKNSTKHKFTAICFALMQAQFIADYSEDINTFEYVTAIVRGDIQNKVIALNKNGKVTAMPFIAAEETLGLPPNKKLNVDRSFYSYKFPTYWLDMDKLIELTKKLYVSGQITTKTLQHYLKTEKIENIEDLTKFSNLLTAEGLLIGSLLTAGEFRYMVDEQVPDIPRLKITPIATWQKGVAKIIKATGIKESGFNENLI